MTREPTMRAALLETRGAPFRIATAARPAPGPAEALVRVVASGVNPLDLKIHAGEAEHARVRLPAVLGIDLAGIVTAVGSQVTRLRPGDEVYGMAGGVGGHQGTLAEYVAVDADLLAVKPARFSMREAAAVPLVLITAWEGLVDRARVQAGQSVLVIGGAGGVGQMAIQIAAAFGAQVFARLGWGTYALAPLSFRAATYSGVFTLLPLLTGEGRAHHGEILAEATKLAEAGKLSARPDPRRFTLETACDAYRAAKSGGGKFVVDVASDQN